MTQGEELLKEAANLLKDAVANNHETLYFADLSKMSALRNKIDAHLYLKSQESSDTVTPSLTWEQARNKKVREYNYDNWDHFVENCTGIGQMESIYEQCFATFMEANRQQIGFTHEDVLSIGTTIANTFYYAGRRKERMDIPNDLAEMFEGIVAEFLKEKDEQSTTRDTEGI